MRPLLVRWAAGAAVALSLFGAAGMAQASSLTSTQISAIIGLLQSFGADQSVIANVQTALGAGPVPNASCVNLSYNLYSGSTDANTNGDVTRLQQFLGLNPTGYFGPMTEQAVQNWQSSHSVVSSGSPDTTGFGYVGTRTRAAMGCRTNPPPPTNTTFSATPTSGVPTITALSPTQGPVGTQVKLMGTGLTSDTSVRFEGNLIPHTFDGTSISFTVPQMVPNTCFGTSIMCAAAEMNIVPGNYTVSVSNVNGRSNVLTFTVTASTSGTPTATISATGCTLPTTSGSGGPCNMLLTWSSANTNQNLLDISITYPNGNVGLYTDPQNTTNNPIQATYGPGVYTFKVYNHNTTTNPPAATDVPLAQASATVTLPSSSQPSATISAQGCTIPVGASSCTGSLTWNSFNTTGQAPGRIWVTVTAPSWTGKFDNPANLTNNPYSLTQAGSWTFQVVDGGNSTPDTGNILATTSANATCAAGSSWDVGSKICTSAPMAQLTTTDCKLLGDGSSPCNVSASWTSANTNGGLVDIYFAPPAGAPHYPNSLYLWSLGSPGQGSIPGLLWDPGTYTISLYNHGADWHTASPLVTAPLVVALWGSL